MSVPTTSDREWASCLYAVEVFHERRRPAVHRFRHRLFTFCFDLDEIDSIAATSRLVGRRLSLYTFRDADHITLGPPTVRENVEQFAARHGADLSGARIRLLTHLRTFGYLFNPVSFYFCSSPSGQPLGLIAEVGNTFGEMKPFWVGPEALRGEDRYVAEATKNFYVSPFLPVDARFSFDVRVPGDRLALRIDTHDDQGLALHAMMTGRRVPLTDAALLGLTLRYPAVTAGVIALIHAHALRLWMKRIPWFRKAANPELQQGVLRPHSSIRTEAA